MTKNVQEIRRIESEKVLGFNPYSKEADSFLIEITPEQAQYILDNHNEDKSKRKYTCDSGKTSSL